MNKMIYHSHDKYKLLHKGNYKGYNYYIISYGTHPCAYVEIPKEHPLYGMQDVEVELKYNIYAHGGLTYSSSDLFLLTNSWFLGWDYEHFGDYIGFLSREANDGAKQWTTEEINEECKAVIDQLEEVK